MNNAESFDWFAQLERTVTDSLVTTFALDFLFFEDKRGGDVDTIHNARQGVYATEVEQQRFAHREDYKSSEYHRNANYIAKGEEDKAAQMAGTLSDAYGNGRISQGDNRDLDHAIAAKEIHDDPGRILAEKSGVDLANRDSNLHSTSSSLNRSKGDKPIEKVLAELDANIARKTSLIQKYRAKLEHLPRDTPEQQHKCRELEDKISANEALVGKLQGVDRDKMKQRDAEARDAYNKELNWAYYRSNKFFGQTAEAVAASGLKMGARQVLGLILAEIWFELKVQVPQMVTKARSNFQLDVVMDDIRITFHAIRDRLEARMSDFWAEFKTSTLAGALSGVTTTLMNIFLTSEKLVVKLIREMWCHLVKAIKLIAFNPEQLTAVDLSKAVTEVLSFGVASVLGAMVYGEAVAVLQFPLGAELAAFVGALSTGLIALVLQYFLFHSEIMQKVWGFFSSLCKPSVSDHIQAANAELDRYLLELAKVDLAMDLDELEIFEGELLACNDDLSLNTVLASEVDRRGIRLPFVMGDSKYTIKWLASKATR